MDKRTKIFLIVLGIISIGVGIWAYLPEKDFIDNYSGIFIGITLIGTVFSIPKKKNEDV